MNINLRILHKGQFYNSNLGRMCYKKGLVKYKEVDPNILSKVALEAMVKEKLDIETMKEIWYSEPGKTIQNGLVYVESNKDVIDMVTCSGNNRVVHLYVVQDGEPSPFTWRKGCKKRQGPTSQPILESRIASSPTTVVNPTLLEDASLSENSTKSSLRKRDVVAGEEPIANEGCLDSENEGSIIGSESSSSDGDVSFQDSGEEDDDLFEDNVDVDVDDLFPSEAFPVEDVVELSNDDSEELKSLSESDGEPRLRYPEFNPLVDFKKKICLKVGMRFGSVDIFRKALRQFSIEVGGDYYYLHNDHKKVSVYCKNKCTCPLKHGRKACVCNKNSCPFKATGRRMGADGTFQLKSFCPTHECGWQHVNTKVTSTWLVEKYIEHHKDDPDWKLTAFMNAVKRDYSMEITYNQAWRARLRANLLTQGDARVQYRKVWDYAATIVKHNPGSSAYVKVCLDNPERPLFQRLYVGLESCKQGYIVSCRPIIGLDGCHLKGAYSGQNLVAVGKDGNENIFPIAYAVVEAERKETWTWFLDILMRDIGDTKPTFMSDRQKGLIEALHEIAPMADTRVCVRHLYNNFKVKWPGKTFKDMLWAAARACTTSDFTEAMEEIKKLDEGAYTYLMNANPETWSKHAFRHYSKSDMLLNNLCESFNAYILRARDKPILTMCKWIRRQLMKRFVKKREGMSKYTGTITPTAMKRIETAKEEGLKMCRVHWGGGNRYEVDHMERTFVVDLAQRTCGCNKWDLTDIPCPHAISCILKSRLKVEDYVHQYYTKDNYMKAYDYLIEPLPGVADWEKTTHTPPEPPAFVVQPGRPKKARRKEVGEEKSRIKSRVKSQRPRCAQCGQEGHYKNRCGNPPKAPEPPKPQNRGGRPRNPQTVKIGSQKRKYVRKNEQAQGSVAQNYQPSSCPENSQVATHVQPSSSTLYEEMMTTFNVETQGSSAQSSQLTSSINIQQESMPRTCPRKHDTTLP